MDIAERRQLWLMLAPYGLGLAVLVALPALVTFGLALVEFDPIGSATWVGRQHFADLGRHDLFATGLLN